MHMHMAMTSIPEFVEFGIKGSIQGNEGWCQAKVSATLLFRFPNVGAGLGQADVRQHAANELPGEFGGVGGLDVEGGYDGKDGGAGFGGQCHVAQVDAVEGRFAHAEDERAALFEGDVGGAGDERIGKTESDGGECAHGAGENDHAGGGMAAAGDGRADVGVGVLDGFGGGGGAEEFFEEIGAAGDLQLFGQDAERVFAGDEMDVGYAVVGFEGAEQLAGEDCAGGAGDGES